MKILKNQLMIRFAAAIACLCVGAGLTEATRAQASAGAGCSEALNCVFDSQCGRAGSCQCYYVYTWTYPFVATGCTTNP